MHVIRYACCVVVLICSAGLLHAATRFSDEPEYSEQVAAPVKDAGTYEQAIRLWNTAEDVNGWIGAHFSYDATRALQLSETQRKKNGGLAVYEPPRFFATRTGVCVDLARFGVETLRTIDPKSDPKYLMIEFEPVQIEGNVLRLHWLVTFRRDGDLYFFADSKRPGFIAGPFKHAETFIREYERYRGRKIVSFRESISYEKQKRARAVKHERQAAQKAREE